MEFIPLTSLWLPILLGAVLVFVASSLIWTVMPHHKADWGKLPDEDGVMNTLRGTGVGHYMFPHTMDQNEFKSETFQKKLDEGPVGLMIVQQADARKNMGKAIGLSFVFNLIVTVFVAYIASRTLAAGAEYMAVFRIVGAVSFLAYTVAMFPDAIWFGRSWPSTWKSVFDGLVYALLTAGAFAGFWPGA